MYNLHTNENLKNFRAILKNINELKKTFIKFRSVNRRINRKQFNFFKFHVLIHYLKCIRYFENIVEMNNSYDECAHKFIIKKFYDRINKNMN